MSLARTELPEARLARTLVAGAFAFLLAGVAAAEAFEPAASSDRRPVGTLAASGESEPAPDPSDPTSAAPAAVPGDEHASPARKLGEPRDPPVTCALEPDREAQDRGLLPVPPDSPRSGLSGCARVARWCLAHATSTATP